MFKDKLKENRLKSGLSQEELARKVFVSRSAIAKWEQGRGLPEDESLDRLAHFFGIPSDELLTKEDMKQEIKANEEDLKKSKKKTLISWIVAGVSVAALAITALCGAFVYNPSGEEAVEQYTVESVEKKDNRLVSIDLAGKGRINYSQWSQAEFRDEYGDKQTGVKDLHLRKGDKVELSYLADKNLFGQRRIGSFGVSELALKAHAYSKENSLFGVGFYFDPGDPLSGKKVANFASLASSAYVRYYETDYDEPGRSCLCFEAKNLFSYKGQVTSGKISASIAVAFDPSVLGATTIRSYFNDLSNQWDTGYFDMADGFESGFPGTSSLVCDMSFSLYGALPNLDVRCGYLTIRYDLVVKQKVNPSRYQIKSYDASDALLGTTVVTPTTDRSSLALPTSRAYSFIEEYQGDALKSTSERIGKGEQYPLYFSNSAGFFDHDSSLTVL